jgi:hypothetical protein
MDNNYAVCGGSSDPAIGLNGLREIDFPYQRIRGAAVSFMSICQFLHACSQLLTILLGGPISVRRSGDIYDPTGLPFTPPKVRNNMPYCGFLRLGR